MNCRFSRIEQGQQRALEIGHAVEADGKHDQRGAAPQHFQHQQHEAEDGQRGGALVPGQQRVAQIGLFATLQAAAGLVQAQAQERAHQQEAGRQRQHVGRRVLEHRHQQPAHGHEAGAIEQSDARAARKIAPAGGQPAQRVASKPRRRSGRLECARLLDLRRRQRRRRRSCRRFRSGAGCMVGQVSVARAWPAIGAVPLLSAGTAHPAAVHR
jgi:hypothetical protein